MAVVALNAAGVTVLIDVAAGRLPAIVHWGPEIPDLDEQEAKTLVAASQPLTGHNDVDVPVRLSVLPELAVGWTGRPGLQGSRAGANWSTRFTSTSVTLDGSPVTGFVSTGSGSLQVTAVDEEAELELDLRIELLPSGLVRARGSGDQHWRRAVHGRRPRPRLPGAGGRRRAARLRRPVGTRARPAAPPVQRRHPPPGEPQGPHRRGQCVRPARRNAGVRLRTRQRVRHPHRVQRQPRPRRRAGLLRTSACSAAASC